ncbi:uncharacterized protein LOC127251273 isoform X2 [Andrographis paniculata]|uniref:uncharacterized protein LOC127251273 isoform X2 n=1 Tax=Andrographis paniculata TaxID=175694 RepID=UPI0021E7364E|nr:uncharacterized protein LOC127251273 isoform X2 [Andrographis paniculata]
MLIGFDSIIAIIRREKASRIMNMDVKKSTLDGGENSLSSEVHQAKIKEVRKLIGTQSGKLDLFCSDETILRYLRARNWNVKKASKMLKATVKWRLEFKPEEIVWDDVAKEAETGKIYRSKYKDKYGRPVLVMRPRCQNSKSTRGQIKHLVYCMENAIADLPEGEEQMVWLVDFRGFSMSNISAKATRETANILQDHYPERLCLAILYDPPKIFEPFWKIVKPFLDPKTANKVRFVYSGDSSTSKFMEDMFNMEMVESAFGGKDSSEFDINKYAKEMREDDNRNTAHSMMDTKSQRSSQPAEMMTEDNKQNMAHSKMDTETERSSQPPAVSAANSDSKLPNSNLNSNSTNEKIDKAEITATATAHHEVDDEDYKSVADFFQANDHDVDVNVEVAGKLK